MRRDRRLDAAAAPVDVRDQQSASASEATCLMLLPPRAGGLPLPLRTAGRRLFPNTQRAADGDELADMIGGVIDHEQDGAEIRLGTLAGRNLRGQIFHFTSELFQVLA
jgi:hypothetical protein